MKAFLKRRWVLLSCSVSVLVCTVGDAIVSFSGTVAGGCGVRSGDLFFDFHQPDNSFEIRLRTPRFGFHAPVVGTRPRYFNQTNTNGHSVDASMPVLIPLAAILGWIVIRELRWREKRAKAATP